MQKKGVRQGKPSSSENKISCIDKIDHDSNAKLLFLIFLINKFFPMSLLVLLTI
jgi:hypothetical protein